jgi:acyl-CoA dehydrogenase
MDFSFTPEQDQIRAHLRDLLSKECPPEYAAKCDDEARPPREAYDALAKNGWFGLIVPAEYGGSGGTAIELAILLEECGYAFEELGMWVFRTLTYGGYAVMRDGTPEQKQQFLPRVAKGEISVCFGIT